MCACGDATLRPRFLGADSVRAPAPDKKVFPKFDVVGWYSTGAELLDADIELQRTVCALTRLCACPSAVPDTRVARAQTMTAITESPVFVLFNPAARNAASKDLPITLYESGA